MENKDTKLCPFCGEEIKVIAKKCMHCKSSLEENSDNTTKVNLPNEKREIQKVILEKEQEIEDLKKKIISNGRLMVGCFIGIITIPILIGILILTGVTAQMIMNGKYNKQIKKLESEVLDLKKEFIDCE